MTTDIDVGPDRKRLNFPKTVGERFAFLRELGFSQIESSPTLVRYRNDGIEMSVYHGRRSYEIGFEIEYRGTKYSMSELIRITDPRVADLYRNFVATSPRALDKGLARLEELVKQYAQRAMTGDRELFERLAHQRKLFAQEYALDVLTAQLRPKAEEAFRKGDYRAAAALYERIQSRLSAAELRKLEVARERAGR